MYDCHVLGRSMLRNRTGRILEQGHGSEDYMCWVFIITAGFTKQQGGLSIPSYPGIGIVRKWGNHKTVKGYDMIWISIFRPRLFKDTIFGVLHRVDGCELLWFLCGL